MSKLLYPSLIIFYYERQRNKIMVSRSKTGLGSQPAPRQVGTNLNNYRSPNLIRPDGEPGHLLIELNLTFFLEPRRLTFVNL